MGKNASLAVRPVELTGTGKARGVGDAAFVRSKYVIDPNVKLLKDFTVRTTTAHGSDLLSGITYANGYFIGLGRWSATTTYRSTDGITWTAGGFTGITGGNGDSLAYFHSQTSRFCIVNTYDTTTTTPFRWSSDNGATWNACGALPVAGNPDRWTAGYDKVSGRIIATLAGRSTVSYSDDGMSTWSTSGTMPSPSGGSTPTCFKGVWYVVNNAAGTNYSLDGGVTWSSFINSGTLAYVRSNDKMLIYSGQYGYNGVRITYANIFNDNIGQLGPYWPSPFDRYQGSIIGGNAVGRDVVGLWDTGWVFGNMYGGIPGYNYRVGSLDGQKWYILRPDNEALDWGQARGDGGYNGSLYVVGTEAGGTLSGTFSTWTDIVDKKTMVTY